MNGWQTSSLAALLAAALVLGLTFGLRTLNLDEGTVIARIAQSHARDTAGRAGDCVGLPGTGRVWLRVVCSGAAPRVYAISRWGRVIAAPETPGI